MEVASELGVDEVVDHGIDQGGGHGKQVDTQIYILYPGKVGKFCKGNTGKNKPLLKKGVKTEHMTDEMFLNKYSK